MSVSVARANEILDAEKQKLGSRVSGRFKETENGIVLRTKMYDDDILSSALRSETSLRTFIRGWIESFDD